MNQVSSHKVGLVFGLLLAFWHAVWSVLVLLGVAKSFMDWILGLHFLSFQYDIDPFSFLNALMLVIVTGIIGYVMGWVAGFLWNWAHRVSHGQ